MLALLLIFGGFFLLGRWAGRALDAFAEAQAEAVPGEPTVAFVRKARESADPETELRAGVTLFRLVPSLFRHGASADAERLRLVARRRILIAYAYPFVSLLPAAFVNRSLADFMSGTFAVGLPQVPRLANPFPALMVLVAIVAAVSWVISIRRIHVLTLGALVAASIGLLGLVAFAAYLVTGSS